MDKRLLFFGLIFLLVYGLGSIFFAEKIAYQKGLGWDGKTYFELTVNFEENLLQHKISPYYMQRILPCAIAYYSLQALDVQINEFSVCNAFLAMSLIALLFAYWVWVLILSRLDFDFATGRLATIVLFVSFPILKLTFYYPVLTDTLAFSFGIFALFFWITNREFWLMIFGIIGNFIWPSFFYFVVPLFLFPYKENVFSYNRSGVTQSKLKLSFFLSLVAGLGIAALSIYAVQFLGFTKQNQESPINTGLIIVSASLAGFYLVLALEPLFEILKIRYLVSLINKGFTFRMLAVILSFVGMALFIQYFKGEGFSIGLRALFRGVAMRSTTQPLIFLVSHLIYLGPAAAIFIINYKSNIQAIRQTGVGLVLLMFPVLFLSLNSESRGLINFFPFIVFIILPRIKEIVASKYYVVLLIFLSILFCKVYFPINTNQEFSGTPQDFPDQRYFMHFGPWMTQESYFINLSLAFTMLAMIFLMFRKHFLSDRV